MKPNLLDYNLDELATLLSEEFGQAKYRAGQIYAWLQAGADFSGMSNIPKELSEKLAAQYSACAVKIIKELTAKDKTRKFLFGLGDGNLIEGVLMKYKYGYTLCVSTQVGCRMGCVFCASGMDGLVRNLSAGEILGQVVAVNAHLGGTVKDRALTNLVLMGSGEPLDNYDNTVKFIGLVSDRNGLNISTRNISLSTCGLCGKMREFADLGTGVNLTVSLHATTDEQRQKSMPAAKKYSVSEIISAAKYYFEKTGRRVIFEYALIQENTTKEDALRLRDLLKGFPSHLNLIMLNEVKGKNIRGCTRTEAEAFLQDLESMGVSVTLRRSMGSEIEGACGQLRNKFVGQKHPVSSQKKP